MSEPKQPGHFHDEGTIAQLETGTRIERVGIFLVGPHHEELAAGPILPAEPQVAAERAIGGAVLEQGAEKHAGRKTVVGSRAVLRGRKIAGGQLDVVERESRLDRELLQDGDAAL